MAKLPQRIEINLTGLDEVREWFNVMNQKVEDLEARVLRLGLKNKTLTNLIRLVNDELEEIKNSNE